MAVEKNKDLFPPKTECFECGQTLPAFDGVKKEFDPEVNSVVHRANEFSVATFEEDQAATLFLGEIKSIFEKAEERRKKMKAPALATCQEIDSFFKEITGPIAEAEKIVKGKKRIWFNAEEGKRIKREADARAKAAEEEKKKKDALEAQAKKAEEKGNAAKAETLREKAENTFIAPEIPAQEIKKTSYIGGYSSTMVSKIKIEYRGPEDAAIREIARAVADGIYPVYFIKVSLTEAEKHFNKNKTAPGPQPGFMLYRDSQSKIGKAR